MAQLPIQIDGKYENKEFKSKEDVWEIVGLLIEETKYHNEQGKSFDIASSVKAQLPFFCCPNIIVSRELQKDIERYIYCEKFGLQPYPGSYGQQPNRWVQKSFIIRKTLAKFQKDQVNDGE